ncbi:hypothetical protein [Mycobacteroides salmoniphilum]|uniref:Uncharacterized protein n=1 Tax=Mycobacteroides salmoniphilum TaxID=404941 RepID=A0A4V3HZF7_9MYCO|nr:hypothetical protein [Mycobacteroides salmoniphilum]TDZ92087.1 hypothetical protein CCUG60885_04201 [Mycobacteroides salmoniphilum]TEA07317.1 hypothetical protein CCUG60883_01350 [Mycobacteroides salmoniphilum]
MSEKLNPSEAQRKAMALALARRVGRESFAQGDLDVVYHQIEAANSVPEGAPVGTIARRPDGEWAAHRTESGWKYVLLSKVGQNPKQDAADSWPVIYDPRAAHVDAVIAATEAYTHSVAAETLGFDPTAQQEPGAES